MSKPWRDVQQSLAAALRDADQNVPKEVISGRKGSKAARFNVYRNNHVISLIDALAANFPVTQEMVGDEFFAALARAFIQDHPPQSPVLIRYGRDFPEFIADFEPAKDLPFLADLAQLDKLFGEAFHASDARAVPVENLSEIPEERLPAARFKLHPSVRLLNSKWPVFSIWQAHQDDGDTAEAISKLEWQPQCGAVLRPELTTEIQLLTPPAFALLSCIARHETLEQALASCGKEVTEDLSGLLAFVFSSGYIAGIELPPVKSGKKIR